MARARSRSVRRSSGVRRSNSRPARSGRQSRGARGGSVHTVRVVVEQPGASALARPELSGLTPAGRPAKSKF